MAAAAATIPGNGRAVYFSASRLARSRAALALSRPPTAADDDSYATYTAQYTHVRCIFFFTDSFWSLRTMHTPSYCSRYVFSTSPTNASHATSFAPSPSSPYPNEFICFTLSRAFTVLSADDFSYDIIIPLYSIDPFISSAASPISPRVSHLHHHRRFCRFRAVVYTYAIRIYTSIIL